MDMMNKLGIFVSGANGRMGKQIIQEVVADQDVFLAGAVEHPHCAVLGADAGLNSGVQQISVTITNDLKRSIENQKGVVIDFSSVESTLENLKRCMDFGIPMVIGTTGFNQEQKDFIREASGSVPIMFAPNMSVGMNVMFKLVKEAAKILNGDYDMEVVDIHHRYKKDAPSGTAMKIARLLCEASGLEFPKQVDFGADGRKGERPDDVVGVQVLRGGDVVGEHTAYFCGAGERLEIKHLANSRATFARGAIRAAKWLKTAKPGLYDMEDVLGLR